MTVVIAVPFSLLRRISTESLKLGVVVLPIIRRVDSSYHMAATLIPVFYVILYIASGLLIIKAV